MWWTRGGRKEQMERIVALEKAVEGFESRSKLLRMEWEDVFDRMNRVMGRLNARIRKSEAVSEPESAPDDSPEGVATPQQRPGAHATLAKMRLRRPNVLPR